MKQIIIGLTGGICSGKSTAIKIFREQGYKVIDADLLGHHAYQVNTPCYHQLIQCFGNDIVNTITGEIDRKVLGGIVFSHTDKMTQLREIVWPEIRRLLIEELVKSVDDKVIIIEAAVLIEAHWEDLVDEIWIITSEVETSLQRLMQRNGLSEEQAQQRLAMQLSPTDRLAQATASVDAVIANTSGIDKPRSVVVIQNEEDEKALVQLINNEIYHRLVSPPHRK
eukprot:gene295-316_t